MIARLLQVFRDKPVADPGFPREGGDNPQGGGAYLIFGQKFPENCMKMKEFGPRVGGGASLAPPLRSANAETNTLAVLKSSAAQRVPCYYLCAGNCSCKRNPV